MLWFVLAILTLAVVAVLVFPIVKGAGEQAAQRVEYDIVVYRDQLAEIDREIERGLMTKEEAVAARGEVHRRMLAAEDAELKTPHKPSAAASRRLRLGAIVAIAVIVPVGAVVLYSILGSPQLPGKPYAWRLKNDPDLVAAATSQALAEQLKSNPSVAGYKRLAQMYFAARNFEQSAAADRRAVELGANDPDTWSELGESVAMSNSGMIVPEALMAFTNALRLDAHDARARFYVGLAESQIGNLRQAVAIWRDLEQDATPDAPWLPLLQQHIAAFSKQGGFDPASVPPSPPSLQALNASIGAMTGGGAQNPHGDIATQAAPAAPAGDDPQLVMIRSMVARLADRMQKNPSDADGWQRLARAYNVLGDQDKARTAIANAVRLKPDDVAVLSTLAEIQKASGAPGDDTPADFIATLRKVLKFDPANEQALYFVGLAELNAGHSAVARTMWNQALAHATGNDDPLAIAIHNRLDGLAKTTKPSPMSVMGGNAR